MSLWSKFSNMFRPNGPGSQPAAAETGIPGDTLEAPARSATGEQAIPQQLRLEIALQSDLGVVRTNNEDRGVYKCPADPEQAATKGTLIVIADGMGGASAGEVASEMAIRLIPDLYYSSTKPPVWALKEAVESASSEIHKTAQRDPALRGMGTTCVAMAILQPQAFLTYVGDSRLYLLRDGSFYQLTEDHTVVVEMVRNGILTHDEAQRHEERNVLSLSVGGRPEITASFWEKPMIVRAGDRFLACTDGLHDLVTDQEMCALIAETPVDIAVLNLIEAARRKGGHDNITAAVVHVSSLTIESNTIAKPTRELQIVRE